MANNVNNGITGVIDIPGALRSRGAADGNLVGGVVAYAGDIYDVTLDKNLAEVNSGFTEAIDDINDNISSIQDDISPFTGSANLQSLVEYDKIEVSEGINASQNNEVYINDKKLAMSFGYNNTISNDRKLAFGFGQQLDVPDNTFVIGQRNSYEPNAAFIVGNGTLNGSTNNAFVIGRDGNFWVYGINGYAGQLTGTSQYNSVNHFITGLDTRLTALEGITSSSSSAPTYSAGTGITISNDTISVDASSLNYNNLSDIPLLKTAENGFKVNAHDRRKNTASAQDSFAEGAGTKASGQGSHSEGGGTIASGTSSHAEGSGASAFGDSSHAEGGGTTATGSKSHAEGNQCSSYGSYSHAEGSLTDARAEASHAEGQSTKALGKYSHAEGSYTHAKADKSHAEGYNTNAQGENSHVEGSGSLTLGNASHAEGSGALAEGVASHAEGYNTEAEADKSHAEGELTHAIGETSHAEGYKTFALRRSHTEGSQVAAISGGHAEGSGSNTGPVVTIQSVSDTPNTLTIITTDISVQVGDILVRKDGSPGEVLNGMGIKILEILNQEGTSAKTDISTSIPMIAGTYYKFTPALGGAFGGSSHSEGRQCAAVGDYGSHAEGDHTYAGGDSSHAEGKCTQTTNEAEHACGKYNLSTLNQTLFSIGNGTSSTTRKNAIEVDNNENVYIKGIGTYDGTNIGQNGVKSVQQVIADLTLQIAALTNN